MGTWQAVWLVASREISTKMRSRSYALATVGMVAAIVVGGVLLKVFGDSDAMKVGLVPETSSLASSVSSLGSEDEEITTVEVTDQAEGEQQLRDGDIDALLVGSPDDLGVVVDSDLDSTLESVFTAISQQQALAAEVEKLGGDPAVVAKAIADAQPDVTALEPSNQDGATIVASYVTGILIFMALITVGQMVAQGVVEEKASRVVELLLAAVRPWQLMTGKVLGIGLVGLIQVGAVVVAGVATATALGLVEASSLGLGSLAIWTLVWFAIGFVTYAVLLAGLASLVSRQEEVGSVISPVTTLMIVPYVVGVSIGTMEPDNPLVVWMSYLPFTSPFVMPVRVAGGDAGTWEALLAAGISIAVVPPLVWLSGRMYNNAVLRTGGRVGIRQALRG
jgi:ABC-2 type transport system permease protein